VGKGAKRRAHAALRFKQTSNNYDFGETAWASLRSAHPTLARLQQE